MVCREDILEEMRSCFGTERKPKQEDLDRRNFQSVGEGWVGDEPVLTREGGPLVRGPSAMDSASIAPSRVRLDLKGLEKTPLQNVARLETENVRES